MYAKIPQILDVSRYYIGLLFRGWKNISSNRIKRSDDDISEMNGDRSNFFNFNFEKKKGLKYLEKKYFNSNFVKLFTREEKLL